MQNTKEQLDDSHGFTKKQKFGLWRLFVKKNLSEYVTLDEARAFALFEQHTSPAEAVRVLSLEWTVAEATRVLHQNGYRVPAVVVERVYPVTKSVCFGFHFGKADFLNQILECADGSREKVRAIIAPPVLPKTNTGEPNLVCSYSVLEDNAAIDKGLRFLGAALDATAEEVHLFQLRPLASDIEQVHLISTATLEDWRNELSMDGKGTSRMAKEIDNVLQRR
ncbi:MAG: hypothetical protein Q7S87_05170 [Agitococcus sp.]|nr:hypothetical protein [Agitococcus sp.]